MDWQGIPKQTYLVENGEIGDCWRCCVAAVLGLSAEDVPHFGRKDDGTHNGADDADTQKWLNERGYVLVQANCIGLSRHAFSFPRWGGSECPLPPLICVGPTVRSKAIGKNHAVVMVGQDVVYDPHPSEAGLTAMLEQYLIIRT